MTLGLAAGMAPGPLLTMVISETIKGNRWNGILISLAPLATDLPIVAISIFGISQLANSEIALGILSVFGAGFLVYIGIKNMRAKIPVGVERVGYKTSLKYGIITNFLSPHPYLFWISVGAPTVIKAGQQSRMEPVYFIIGFYLLLIGSKISVALISERAKHLLKSTWYMIIVKVLGIALIFLAVLLLIDALRMLYSA